MRRSSFLVRDNGVGPQRPLRECMYCRAAVETEHKPECVMRRRTVVLRATVEFVALEPESWDPAAIEAYYNEGTWCADNLPAMLAEHVGGEGCLCPATRIEYVREADEADEAGSAVRVDRVPHS